MSRSSEIFIRAKEVLPGGVNSPVRAFLSVGDTPRFIESAKGATITDVDGNTYLDYISSWGPMITGHANERILNAITKTMSKGLSFGAATEVEVDVAELICSMVGHVEMIRMVNSGTEAVMSALRLARGYTKRDKIIKFAGCYHGHTDSMLVKAGSGVLTAGNPDSMGVCEGVAKDTLIANYNDLESVSELLESNKGQVACIIVEPVAANMGVVAPKEGFLEGLRALCDEYGTLLIFDEVITGFRLALGGASEFFGVEPDIVTYGKIIGAGMPVGAYGARKEIMNCVAPLGGVYQAGTLSGNPIAMAAGLEGLTILKEHPEVYTHINDLGEKLAAGYRELGFKCVNQVGSLVCPFFTDCEVIDYESAKTSDTAKYSEYFKHMLNNSIYIAPSQFEAMFMSNEHTEADIKKTLEVAKNFFL
ncbi:MAG: glutamate-1-semialdehyde 2,1-aminomutase [Lachnospiraceae bacterium]